jgi:pimeloyl-ACP methyl ester carboxylesterase
LNRNTYCRTIANELNTSDVDTSLPNPPEKLGDIPLVVLVAGQDMGGPPGGSSSGASNPSPGLGGSRWLRLQQDLADLSTHGRLVVAENSSHYIHLDQPELVIQTILDVLETARQNEK